MSNPTNPTNAYTVPSVSIATAHTGASRKANALGMRVMQGRAYATARADLAQLAETGMLEEGRRGKSLAYTVPADLQSASFRQYRKLA